MRIAVVHYHLRRGGVTRVIESAGQALAGSGHEFLVLSGEEPHDESFSLPVTVVAGLSYRRNGNTTIAASLVEALRGAARRHFGGPPDLWHFHNHSLAKNVLMPSVVRELAEAGEKVLLQMHDFPEDGRPTNYATQRSFFDSERSFRETLYPEARQVHYAAINNRDRDFLAAAGVRSGNLHSLPNAVSAVSARGEPGERPFAGDRQFVLYPTRAIRRKNLGELMLLAWLFRDTHAFATTLSPDNPEWLAIHERWRSYGEERELPVTLAAGEQWGHSFEDLVAWSDAIVTTSIAEGFGLAFLEPWLAGKSVNGRDLPEITRDFADCGIGLDHLYGRLGIPAAWLDTVELRAEIDAALRQSYLAYDRRLPAGAVDRTWSSWVAGGRVDFGVLSERWQERILEKLRLDPGYADEIEIPSLAPLPSGEIAQRAKAVEDTYSLSSYGEKLAGVYETIAASSAGRVRHVDPEKLLDQFLAPERLNLLRA